MFEERIKEIYEVTDQHVMGFFNDHRYLSNFHLCPVFFEGVLYPSSENAYQAAKINISEREKLKDCSPAESKSLWKLLTPLYSAEEWDEIKFNVMLRIVTEKFLTNNELLEKLKLLDGVYLEETNWWKDTYWGVCNNFGENNLGRILMHVRDSQFLSDIDIFRNNLF